MQKTALQYFDRAMTKLRDLGLVPDENEEAPIIALLNRLTELDEANVTAIARTLSQASLFNEIVREQVSSMKLGERYEKITGSFNSIREDAKTMVEQVEDGKIDTFERISNVWMKATRGDIAHRFDEIKETYLEVAADSKEQIERELTILDAYQDFRGALKSSEVLSLEVLKKAEEHWETAKSELGKANDAVAAYAGEDMAERATLELARDEKVRELQFDEDRYQIAKDLSDNLTVGYNTSEFIMARLMQTTSAKERVYKQAIMFFGTNETVLTALSASFTGMFGLHESTKSLEAMKEGVSESLEDLADIGGKVQEAAVRAGYGPTIRAESVAKLVDSVVNFQARSRDIIEEMRVLATKNADEIRESVEDGKQRLAKLIQQGGTLPQPTGI
ncbi:MAG: cell surface protein [Gammaproteobacteria bacterium]|nr:cell surface protein [Gammaproteobacteria bacterium]NNF49306.1 cell surface protein [Woeseiaceae bacterium]MBT8094800.1 cell surface protein [Gammaproteobacteria bacterium]MBT8105968.1 cell surface protein [Gammaproteobacteria bacterium]NNK25981.1 cell surface protein [Woeseiaceae bacterium]